HPSTIGRLIQPTSDAPSSQLRLPPRSTLFPYTTLFRSLQVEDIKGKVAALLGTMADDVTINDVAAEPGTSIAYLSVSRGRGPSRSEEHTSELQSRVDLVCRLLLEKKKSSGHCKGPRGQC